MKVIYKRLASKCETINQLNRLHIGLENRLSPLELFNLRKDLLKELEFSDTGLENKFHLASHLREDKSTALTKSSKSALPEESFYWLAKMEAWSRKSGKESPEPFSRKNLLPNVVLYSAAGEKLNKILLVCLTGRLFRLMMPIPVFLQHLSSPIFDVIVIKDPRRNGYRDGLKFLGNSLEATILNLDSHLNKNRYRSVVGLGVSGGGLPAIIMSLSLGFNKGVSICGNSLNDPRWRYHDTEGLQISLSNLVKTHEKTPNILAVYGSDHLKDKDSAASLLNCIPCQLLEIKSNNPESAIGHNVLQPILEKSKLAGFLARVLDPEIYGYDNTLGERSEYMI